MGQAGCLLRENPREELTKALAAAQDENKELRERLRAKDHENVQRPSTSWRCATRCNRRTPSKPSPTRASSSRSLSRAKTQDALEKDDVVNTMLLFLWPYLSRWLRDKITQLVQPAVQKALGSLGQAFSFKRENCQLGDEPVQIQVVRVNKVSQTTLDGHIEALVIRAEVEWKGDVSVYMEFAKAGLGINSLTIQGEMLIEFPGLIERPPFFQGVRAYFIEPPNVEMGFQGMTRALNVGLIYVKLRDVISTLLSNVMVVPNMVGAVLDANANYFRIMRPRPEGVLRLTVIRAAKLKAMDHHIMSPSSSDPFVQVRCGSYFFQSPTAYKTLDPDWDFSMLIPIHSEEHQKVRMRFYDEDTLTEHDFLGSLDLKVRAICAWEPGAEMQFELHDDEGERGDSGTVWLSARWSPFTVDRRLAHGGTILVFAGIHAASNLPLCEDGTCFWVVAQCSNLAPDSPLPEQQETQRREFCQVDKQADANEESELLAKKAEILDKYGVSIEDQATLLGIDRESWAKRRSGAGLDASGLASSSSQKVIWNRACTFLVDDAENAALDFALKRKEPRGVPETRGTRTVTVAEIANCPHSTLTGNLTLDGPDMQHVHLNVWLQVRFAAGPKSRMRRATTLSRLSSVLK
mmetsp:Transcript_9549/g.22524  ORF Transcript_9549/g.22524 Transcript_9549/m.22524 type:complete len:634 (-) Transcript_9549:37-1938(-)